MNEAVITVLISSITTIVVFIITTIVGKNQRIAEQKKSAISVNMNEIDLIAKLEGHIAEQVLKIIALQKQIVELEKQLGDCGKLTVEEVAKVRVELLSVKQELSQYKAYIEILTLQMKAKGVEVLPIEILLGTKEEVKK